MPPRKRAASANEPAVEETKQEEMTEDTATEDTDVEAQRLASNSGISPERAKEFLEATPVDHEVSDEGKEEKLQAQLEAADKILEEAKMQVLLTPQVFFGQSGTVDTSGTSGMSDSASMAAVSDAFNNPVAQALVAKSAAEAGEVLSVTPSLYEAQYRAAQAAQDTTEAETAAAEEAAAEAPAEEAPAEEPVPAEA